MSDPKPKDTIFVRFTQAQDVPHLSIIAKKLQQQVDNAAGVPGPPGPQGNPGPPGAQGPPGAGAINYSLAEQRLGIGWVDGRPVYQTTINLGTINFPTDSASSPATTVVNHLIPNIQRFVDFSAFVYLAVDPTNTFPVPYISNQGFIGFSVTSTFIGVTTTIVGAGTGYSGYATLRYTCTDR